MIRILSNQQPLTRARVSASVGSAPPSGPSYTKFGSSLLLCKVYSAFEERTRSGGVVGKFWPLQAFLVRPVVAAKPPQRAEQRGLREPQAPAIPAGEHSPERGREEPEKAMGEGINRMWYYTTHSVWTMDGGLYRSD